MIKNSPRNYTRGSVAVFCSSAEPSRSEDIKAVKTLVERLVEHRFRFVFGGGRVGLMGELATCALEYHGEIVGVIPQHLVDLEVADHRVTQLKIVESMHERKKLMADMADAFLILPGGLGTLDEGVEIITWRKLGLHDKPILFLNVEGFWNPLLETMEHMKREGMFHDPSRQLFQVVETADQAAECLIEQVALRA